MTACPNIRRRGRTFAMGCACLSCTVARNASRRRSVANGFPPFDWHAEPDEIAVERTLRGDRPARLAPAERLEVVRVATARGESAAQIARRLRMSERTVTRYRARLAA